jgi:hypothetical protein
MFSFDDLGSSLMLFGGANHAIPHPIDDETRARMSFDPQGESSYTTISKSRPLRRNHMYVLTSYRDADRPDICTKTEALCNPNTNPSA